MYDADFGVDGGLALGYATTAAAPLLNNIPTITGILNSSVMPIMKEPGQGGTS